MFEDLGLSEVSAGKKAGYSWHYDPRPDSAEGRIGLPLGVIGNGRSPVALLVGGTHGDESIGPSVITKLFHTIAAKDVLGTIVFCPASNVSGVTTNSRFAPQDGKNMNRLYPGHPSGSLSERLCSDIANRLIAKSDLVFDIHSGGRSMEFLPGTLLRLSGDAQVDQKSWELAQSFGAPYTYVSLPSPTHSAHVSIVANRHGKPSIATEIGGSELVDPTSQDIAIEGIFNSLAASGVIARDVIKRPTVPLFIKNTLYASHSGFFLPEHSLGHTAVTGQPAGMLYQVDDLTALPTPLVYPGEGVLACWRRLTHTTKGDCLLRLAVDGVPYMRKYGLSVKQSSRPTT